MFRRGFIHYCFYWKSSFHATLKISKQFEYERLYGCAWIKTAVISLQMRKASYGTKILNKKIENEYNNAVKICWCLFKIIGWMSLSKLPSLLKFFWPQIPFSSKNSCNAKNKNAKKYQSFPVCPKFSPAIITIFSGWCLDYLANSILNFV